MGQDRGNFRRYSGTLATLLFHPRDYANVLEDLTFDRQLKLGLDMLVSAETGSGKTLAYLIPLVERILSSDISGASGALALVLVPTRELARQVLKQTRLLIGKSKLNAVGITGGADTKYQKSLLRKDPEILIATPGRLLDLSGQRSVDLSNLKTLVLDEADRMLDLGFRDDVLALTDLCANDRQILMLSATLEHKGVLSIAKTLLVNPETVSIGETRQAHKAIKHQVALTDSLEHKDKLLHALVKIDAAQRVLVFTNKRSSATRLAHMLSREGIKSGCLHGDLSTEQRKQVMEQFSNGTMNILCASDVAARGLDVKNINLVINFDLPFAGDDYLHRTGRTGRAGESGVAISFVGAPDWDRMISIQRYLNQEFERLSVPGLKARYNGPKKQKSSGKAAGTKKKKSVKQKDARKKESPYKETSKKKTKTKDTKSKKQKMKGSNDGFAPLMKKKKD
jgi:superfamily II DNA/RNA helicase